MLKALKLRYAVSVDAVCLFDRVFGAFIPRDVCARSWCHSLIESSLSCAVSAYLQRGRARRAAEIG